ncbi:MAG: hypothetical protein OXC91_11640 [Rhodobacteraceae bacterium]|nr:hypothetical protein [Paracoccaceae bacterium]
MSKIEKLILTHTAIVFLLGVVIAIVNPDYFGAHYIDEDGFLEWLTVLALGTITVVLVLRFRAEAANMTVRQKITLIGLAILAAFGAGEEISWGQRLFAIETPEALRVINRQDETNIHNLVIGRINVNKTIFSKGILLTFLIYLGVITPLWHRSPRARAFLDSWGVPIPKRYQWASYLAIIILVEGVINLLSPGSGKRGELTEFAVPMIVALNIFYPLNQAPTGIMDQSGKAHTHSG